MPGRAITRNKRRGRLHQTGDPSLLRMIALEYIKSFDEEKVAKQFQTKPSVIRKVVQREDIQEYLAERMIPIQDLAEMGARRLLEETLKTAFDEDAEWKERTENRKLLAKALLPEIKKISVEHNHYVRAPGKIEDMDEWSKQFQPQPAIEAVQDAEFEIEDD